MLTVVYVDIILTHVCCVLTVMYVNTCVMCADIMLTLVSCVLTMVYTETGVLCVDSDVH